VYVERDPGLGGLGGNTRTDVRHGCSSFVSADDAGRGGQLTPPGRYCMVDGAGDPSVAEPASIIPKPGVAGSIPAGGATSWWHVLTGHTSSARSPRPSTIYTVCRRRYNRGDPPIDAEVLR